MDDPLDSLGGLRDEAGTAELLLEGVLRGTEEAGVGDGQLRNLAVGLLLGDVLEIALAVH